MEKHDHRPKSFDIDQRFAQFEDAMARWTDKPPLVDYYVRAFASGMLEALENPEIKENLRFLIPMRPDFTGTHWGYMILRGITKQIRRAEEQEIFPFGYDEPPVWTYLITEGLKSEDSDVIDGGELGYDLTARKVQSNIGQRAEGIKLATMLIPELKDKDNVTIFDAGCSANFVAKILNIVGKQDGEFAPTGIMGLYDTSTGKEQQLSNSQRDLLEYAITELFNAPQTFDGSLGIDIADHRSDPTVMEWIEACTVTPGELIDNELRALLERLKEDVPGIHFRKADFEKPDQIIRALESVDTKKFDVITWLTVLYQFVNIPDVAKQVEKNLAGIADIEIVQDFASVNPKDKTKLIFSDKLDDDEPFTYRTMIRGDSKESPREFEEMARWYNGRCQSLKLNLGHPAVDQFVQETI